MIFYRLYTLLAKQAEESNLQKKKKETGILDQHANAEMDANEPQQSDLRERELLGDTAYELRDERNENEAWELMGDAAYELRGETNENEAWELSGDMAHELRHSRHGNEVEELCRGIWAYELRAWYGVEMGTEFA